MKVYTLCEKKHGPSGRCDDWPKCCDWYDRPTRVDGTRPWVHLPDSALLSHTAACKMAQELRLQHTRIVKGLDPKPKPPAPLLSVYIGALATATAPATGYLGSGRVQRHTSKDKTARVLGRFLTHVGDRPLDTVTKKMIEQWEDAEKGRYSKKSGGTLSENTVQRQVNVVKGLFSYAAEEDDDLKTLALENPCEKIGLRSEPPAARVVWRPEHEWLIEQLPPRYRRPALVARKAGPRRNEILALTKYDLSDPGYFERVGKDKFGYILFQRQKRTDRSLPKEPVPVDYALVQELWSLFKGRPTMHQYVFGDENDVYPKGDTWSSHFTREIRKLGAKHDVDVTGICIHGGRHTATGKMQRGAKGVDIHTAQRMGGWQNVSQVASYSQVPDASMLLAAAQLKRTYQPKKPTPRKQVAK